MKWPEYINTVNLKSKYSTKSEQGMDSGKNRNW